MRTISVLVCIDVFKTILPLSDDLLRWNEATVNTTVNNALGNQTDIFVKQRLTKKVALINNIPGSNAITKKLEINEQPIRKDIQKLQESNKIYRRC